MAATTRPSSTANLFAFEEILDFNGHKGETAASQQKQLACLRCHAQKLGCVRHEHNGACERCRATKVNCVARQPQRMGRPADSRWLGRRGHQRREESSEHQQPSPSPLSTVNTSAATSTTSSTATSESNNTSISAVSPPNTSVTMSPIWPSTLRDMPSEDISSLQNWSFAEYPLDATSAYEGSLFPGPRGLDSMLPDFEACPSEVLDHITKGAQNAPSAAPWEAQDNPAGSVDPTEQLTKLHLDLHECLMGMQLMEARARTKQPGGSNVFPGTKTIDQAFHLSERFVQTLNELPMEEKENSRPILHPPEWLLQQHELPRGTSLSILYGLGWLRGTWGLPFSRQRHRINGHELLHPTSPRLRGYCVAAGIWPKHDKHDGD